MEQINNCRHFVPVISFTAKISIYKYSSDIGYVVPSPIKKYFIGAADDSNAEITEGS